MLVTSLEFHVLVTLPLLVLSAMFRWLLPLALISFGISLIVCAVAALQASISKDKKRFWSRPLVALLFFLQPIVRGWARYQGRLSSQQKPLSAFETLESLSHEDQRQNYGELQYWDDRKSSRLDFVDAIMRQLDQKGWTNKADAGWNEFDIEIYGSRWCRLQ